MQAETELRLSIWQRRSLTFGYQADSAKHLFLKPCNALEIESRSNKIPHIPPTPSPQAEVALQSFGKLLQKTKPFLLSPEWSLTLFPKAAAGRFPLLVSRPCSCRAKVAAEIPFCLHLICPPRPTDCQFALCWSSRGDAFYLHPSSLVACEVVSWRLWLVGFLRVGSLWVSLTRLPF